MKINLINRLLMSILLCMISVLFSACKFQPNDAEGIGIYRIANDTLEVLIVDSYYIIDKYNVKEKKDTLFINVNSTTRYFKERKNIFIPLSLNIKYVKLQNDRLYKVEDIYWKQ